MDPHVPPSLRCGSPDNSGLAVSDRFHRADHPYMKTVEGYTKCTYLPSMNITEEEKIARPQISITTSEHHHITPPPPHLTSLYFSTSAFTDALNIARRRYIIHIRRRWFLKRCSDERCPFGCPFFTLFVFSFCFVSIRIL